MTTAAIGPYEFTPKDEQANFHGNAVVYAQWEQHLMFCAPFAFPVPLSMPFQVFVDEVVMPVYAAHPEVSRADFKTGQWTLNGVAFEPDLSGSLEANGVTHKAVLRVKTPELTGIDQSSS